MTGFYIAEVRFRGRNVPDIFVNLQPGLSVVAGPSNTGKSLLRTAISFVFGSDDAMKDVPERSSYTAILVEVRTYSGDVRTYERAWNGGAINEYHAPAGAVSSAQPTRVLAEDHASDNDDNISRALLNLAGFDHVKLIKNAGGETRNLSFWLLAPYVLVSEERIITELSPIHRGSEIHATSESALFRTILTGIDDRDVIKAISAKEKKALAAGRALVIDTMREDLRTQIGNGGMIEADAKHAATSIAARINEQSRRLEAYRADTMAIEQRRRDLQQESERVLARITQIDANLKRFDLLQDQYNSDLQRLQSNIEAGDLLGGIGEGLCPICGATAEHQVHAISEAQLDDYVQASRVEASKIAIRQADLKATIEQLQHERTSLAVQRAQLDQERLLVANQLKAVLAPGIGELNQSLDALVDRRQDLEHLLDLFEQLRRLDKLEASLTPVKKKKQKKETATAVLPTHAYEDFAKAAEVLLRAWSFPELDRVVFDPNTEDLVISGKARKDNGKGYRAITYAAFVLAAMMEAQRKTLPHPGFVVLDSPLVTYREPDEHIGEGVKSAFYRNLATLTDMQVIVLENEEPPGDLQSSISFTAFTKGHSGGRYGLLPVLPTSD